MIDFTMFYDNLEKKVILSILSMLSLASEYICNSSEMGECSPLIMEAVV